MLPRLLVYSFLSLLLPLSQAEAAAKWTEFNIGPFYVDTESDTSAARYQLTQLEQLRWVLGGLLEVKDLNSTWPIRVILSHSSDAKPHFALHNGCYLLVVSPNGSMPLGEIAQLFLDANTPRLPAEAESGLDQLFDTLKANGPHVSWGGPPTHSDLAFARMQLFATKFEYGASFHILVTSLCHGSDLIAAERNAFGRDPQAIEKEASQHLAANVWQAVSFGGRPLNPNADFGTHTLDSSIAQAYLAAALIPTNPGSAESMLKQVLNEDSAAKALVFESLAQLDLARRQTPDQDLQDAMDNGSKSAWVYWQAAKPLPPDQARSLLDKAALLNPLWYEPIFAEAQITENPAEREALLKKASDLNPRATDCLVALARTQMSDGHAIAAQSTWVRAENSAPTAAKRQQVENLHDQLESERLDAVAAERTREKNDAILADQHAQQSEADRIRAAEDKANQAQAEAAGNPAPAASTGTVEWQALVKPQKTFGRVVMVDCRKGYQRIAVKDLRGQVRQLLYINESGTQLFSCDGKADPRQIVVTFRPHPDDYHATDGEIVSIAWR